MNRKDYGEFMTMKDVKKVFGIKDTHTMMRFVHRQQIPYKKETKKLLFFVTDAVFAKVQKIRSEADRYIRGMI
jgi:ribosomal protein S26